MTDQIYKVGMIGLGRKGHGHARGYEGNPRTEIVAGADPDADNRTLFLKRFPVTGYSDYHEMLQHEQIDIAAPILPVSPNPEVVIDCARAGVKAIYCEKPMASSLQESDQMVEETRSRGIYLASGDAYRNMPQHWKVRRLIDSGEMGEVQSINLYQSTNEISGGGCQGLSVMRLFAGDSDVDWVIGWCDTDPFSDDDQNMGGYVKFKNGIDAFVHNKPSAVRGIEVVCTEGIYRSSFDIGEVLLGGNQKALKVQEGFFDEFGSTDHWTSPSGTRQRGGIQAIVESLDQGIDPRCSGDNMGKVLEIAIGFRESHRRGFAPVKFPIEDRSLALYPKPGRLHNKKDVYGEEAYAEMIGQASDKPIGGAEA